MGFALMTTAELKTLGLEGQEYPNLDKEIGILYNRFFKFQNEFISDDFLQFRRKYSNGTNTVYLISFVLSATGGKEYTKYEFYKEV